MYCVQDTSEMTVSDNGTCSSDENDRLAPADYDWSTSNTAKRHQRMRDVLSKQNREILLSICVWGFADVYKWCAKFPIACCPC